MNNENKQISVARGTAVVGSLTLLSRVLGFTRDLLIARGFGSGAISDCFFVAYRIPNLLRSLVAEGALSSAFVPIFADSLVRGKDHARKTLGHISSFLLLTTILFSILGIVFSRQIVAAFAPGFKDTPHLMDLCASLTSYMMPIIICVSFVAMLNGALNSLGRFGAAAWAQVWMNLALIAGALGALFTGPELGIKLLAWSALAGAGIQVIVQIPELKRTGLFVAPSKQIYSPEVGRLLRLMAPAVIGATVYQLGIFLDTVLASLVSDGAVSWLYYADRLVQFPLGTFSIALGSVLLPALSMSHAKGEAGQFTKSTFDALRYTAFLMFPLSAGLYLLAEPLTQLLFERGSFHAGDTIRTAHAVRMFSFGLWAVSSHTILARSFIARKDTITTTAVGIFSLLINFTASLLCAGQLQSSGSGLAEKLVRLQVFLGNYLPVFHLGHAGLALGSSIAAYAAFFILAGLALRSLAGGWRAYLKSCSFNLTATAVAAIVSWLVIPTSLFGSGTSATALIQIVSTTAVFCAVWTLMQMLLGTTELRGKLADFAEENEQERTLASGRSGKSREKTRKL